VTPNSPQNKTGHSLTIWRLTIAGRDSEEREQNHADDGRMSNAIIHEQRSKVLGIGKVKTSPAAGEGCRAL
jgi:hypothetical protein